MRLAEAIQGLAGRVEDAVATVVAAPKSGRAAPEVERAPHSAVIKQVRHAQRKMDSAKEVDGSKPENYWQPHLSVAVSEMKPGATATRGTMMVDTGASISLVTRKWAEAHGLSVTPVSGISISGANGNPVETVGTCAMTLQLAPTLELDVAEVNVSTGDFYQALIGGDILGGLHTGGATVLGPAVIHMPGPGAPGHVSWMQPKSGCAAHAKILAPKHGWVAPINGKALPPPPAAGAITFETEGVRLSEEHKKELRRLAEERDAQRRPGGNDSDEAFRSIMERARNIFRAAALPVALCELLRSCLAQRSVRHPTEHLLAKVLAAAQKQSMEAAS